MNNFSYLSSTQIHTLQSSYQSKHFVSIHSHTIKWDNKPSEPISTSNSEFGSPIFYLSTFGMKTTISICMAIFLSLFLLLNFCYAAEENEDAFLPAQGIFTRSFSSFLGHFQHVGVKLRLFCTTSFEGHRSFVLSYYTC